MNKTLMERNFPAELKTMSEKELGLLSYQIRDFLIEKVAQSGGHLASNLGVVELSIALHYVFDSPHATRSYGMSGTSLMCIRY